MLDRRCLLLAPAILLAAAFSALYAADAPATPRTQWRAYGGGPDNIHYSTLTQINRQNASQLKLAWSYDSGDAFPESEMECNPIVVDGVLFATTPKLRLIALDAATGALKWSFDPNKEKPSIGKQRNRGITYWEGSGDSAARVFFAAQQNLYAVSAATGEPVAEFGSGGHIDMRDNLGREDSKDLMISTTSPPVIYKDLLIVGSIVSETLPALPGDIRAYDVRTGKLRWSFHTIPHPGEFGYNTWPPDTWKYIGGVNAWSGLSLDRERAMVYVPTGSATFDFYGSNRLGDDLFANCLLALKADTGERVWHFQTVRHDLWDRDLPTPPALVSVLHEGRQVDALAQITKSGFVYLFDRDKGTPLFPVEYRKYPSSDVDGEKTADTQPLPTKPAPFARQILTEENLTKRTPEAHEEVLQRFRKIRSNGQFMPPSLAGTVVFPGFDGGGEWGGPSFDPETGLLYVNANEMPWILRLVNRESKANAHSGRDLYLKECAGCHRQDLKGSPPEFPALDDVSKRLKESDVESMIRQGGGRMPSFARLAPEQIRAITRYVAERKDTQLAAGSEKPLPTDQKYAIDGYNKFLDKDGYPAVEPPWGTLNAINLNTGDVAWKIPFGEYPELVSQGLRNTGSENYGGSVVTAGGLLIIAATNQDNKMHVFDKSTGKLLWEAVLPAAGNATPAVFELNGKEYIVIACGGGKAKKHPSGGSYVAFSLP